MFSRAVSMVPHEILKDHADAPAQVIHDRTRAGRRRPAGSGPQSGSYRRVSSLMKRGLAGAVRAHQRDLLAGADGELKVAQHPLLTAGVAERHIAKLDAFCDRPRHLQRLRSTGICDSSSRKPNRLLMNSAFSYSEFTFLNRPLKCALALAKDRQIQGHAAQRDRSS